jgi:flagellar hook-length control protein FliK
VNALGDDHAVVPQIVKAIRLQWRQGLGEAKIRLEPEHLGEVQVSLRVQAGVVTAVVKAENPTVQGWIENRQQELRNALDEQGLRLQRFEVVVDPESRRQPRETPEGNPLRRLRRSDVTEPEFEIEI